MFKYFKKIWSDPVWSSVIASAILSVSSAFFFSQTEDISSHSVVNYNYSLDYKLLLYVAGCSFVVFYLIRFQTQKPRHLEEADLHIVLSQWWPSVTLGSGNIIVDYRKVDKQLRLPLGSTKKHIDRVAKENYYKVKNVGDKYAEYTEDTQRIFNPRQQ